MLLTLALEERRHFFIRGKLILQCNYIFSNANLLFHVHLIRCTLSDGIKENLMQLIWLHLPSCGANGVCAMNLYFSGENGEA